MNRYETIAIGDRLPRYLNNCLICSKRDYKQDLKKTANLYLKVKTICLAAYVVLWVAVTLATYSSNDVRQVVWPIKKSCGGPSEALVFNANRAIPFRCHFDFETIIFIFVLSSDVLKVVLFISFLLSTYYLRVYCRRVAALAFGTVESTTELSTRNEWTSQDAPKRVN